jgi:uncharacterized protein
MIGKGRRMTWQRAGWFGLLPVLVVGVLATAALALNFPALTGRVVDEANVLDQATRNALTQKLADLETKTTDQFVVVTLKSLQGTSIEDFGYQLGRYWGVGQKGKNNGVLLIVAPNERKVRIEVGYGLEGTLTDALTKVIIEGAIVPRFRANDIAGGITRGANDVIQVLSGDAELLKPLTATRNAPRRSSPDDRNALLSFLIWLAVVSFILFVTMSRRSRYGRRGGGPWLIPTLIGSSGWSSGSSDGFGGGSGGGFSGGGGSFGGGGSSGSW